MAYRNKIIQNPVTGQEIRFVQTGKETNGELLEMESTWHTRSSTAPLPHYHPQQKEDFIILKGSLTIRIDGRVKTLHAGDKLHIPAGKAHSMWNESDQPVVANWKVRPAMDTDHLLEMGMGLANDGKVNEKGMPSLLQTVVMANKFSPVFRIASTPFALQKLLFIVLLPFAWLSGYQPLDKKYID